MFRRRSSSRHQPLNTTPSASAQTAATRAFTANRDANLSSAAAAAALRSHTPPPTTPGNVQTKRMLQRQLSNSSRGSSVGGLHHGSQSTLHRSSSSGSMASRTFRDQSPGRTQTTAGKTQNLPPVPPIPQSPPNRDTPPHRSASVQPTSHSGTTSPLRKLVGGRGASLDRGPRMTASPVNPRTAPKGTSPELERPGSRTSINFSYPINARPNSPRQSPVDGGFSLSSGNTSPTPPSLSPVETASIQQSINDAANRKVKLKPKTAAPASKEGSHFAHKTMGSRPTGTAVATDVQSKLHDGTAGEEDMSGVSVTDFAPHHEQPAAIDQDQSQMHITNENGDSLASRPRPKKRPSMVMEDHEGEELAEAAAAAQEGGSSFPTISQVPVQSSETGSEVKPAREALVIYPPKNIQVTPSVASAYSPSPSSSQSSPGDRLTADTSIDSQLPHRQPSISPNRSARFSAQLTVGSESPLHEPPPRSLSPAKPALKQSSSPDRRIHFGQTPSEISDVTSVASDDGSHTGSRRRTAKVSFDDEAEVFGMAASPPTSPEPTNRDQSPVEKTKPRKWFNIGKKKSVPRDVSEDDEFESVLRPRPALPNFGSIRGNREEETVVVADNDGDSDSSSDDAVQPHGLVTSSDFPIEGKSVDDYSNQARAVQPDISLATTNSNIVTKKESVDMPVEGTNAVSTRGFDHLPPVQEEQDSERSSVAAVVPAAQTDKMITNGETAKLPHEDLQETVPIIAIQPATPAEEPRNSIDMDEMPGGFPSYVSESKTLPKSTTIHDNTHTMDKRIENVEDDDDDSGDSIYSDAAEDPEDMDGELFGSIDAIVDSAVPAKTLFPKEVPESPTRRAMRADSLSDLSEPVPSPSLETIQPRMPATPSKPMQSQANGSANVTEKRFEDSFGDSSSSWPLNDNTKPSFSASIRQQVAAKTAEPNQGSHLRKALGKESDQRQQAPPRQSMRTASGPAVSPSAKQKMTTSVQASSGTLPTKQVSKTLPRSKTFPAGFNKISANDSDSDSSFKRTRRSSRASNNGPYSMKRTMRATRPVSLANPETFTERTMSPPRTSSMRTTMRSPTFDRSSGMSSLRDKSGRSRPRSSVLLSNTRSRVGDSDGDSRGGRLLFQSRFADSSDEDEPGMSRLAPVRGIPRRKGRYDGESTDLDDSSDDEVGRTMRNGVSKDSAKPLSPEDLEAIFVQPKKKGGIFSRLRSPARAGRKDGKVRKSMTESPARRDTPLERSRLELARVREDAPSPKLHKRQKATRMTSDTWPLPLETSSRPALTSNQSQDRPLTSDGIAHSINGDSSRLSFNRHGTHESIDSRVTSAASEVVLGRTGKKKRFPMLRRAFGLRD